MKTIQKTSDGKFSVELHTFGSGEPLLFLHGAGGLLGVDSFLEELGRDFKVIAPHLPGYGESSGGELIEDVVDTSLFYHQLMDDLGIDSAHIIGHSMGGMLAAELAALDIHRVKKLILVAAAGFWLPEHPIPDFFALDAGELGQYLFHDPNSALAKMMMAVPEDMNALADMYVERVKRLSMASKFLWPIPDRGLKKRAYRIAAPTLLLWGESDKLVPPVYANEFASRIRNSRQQIIKEAGHVPMYEQQAAFCAAVREFLKS